MYSIVLVPLCSFYVECMYVRITMKCFGTDSALTENDCFAEHSLFFSSSYTKDQLNPPKHARPIASHLKKTTCKDKRGLLILEGICFVGESIETWQNKNINIMPFFTFVYSYYIFNEDIFFVCIQNRNTYAS